MKTQKITAFLGKTGSVASLVAASALTAGLLAPSASAVSLVPQVEKEVNVGLGCLDLSRCINLPSAEAPYITNITSVIDETTGTKSRLFVDRRGTDNVYGSGDNTVTFDAEDIGTPAPDYWFRPVALDPDGTPFERGGQLEVGTFDFDFANTLKTITFRWFDVETTDTSKYDILTDGTLVSGSVPSGPDGNIYELTYSNVSFAQLKLGAKGVRWVRTGDGVLVQFDGEPTAVPEPGTALGLGALAFMSTLGLRKRNKKAN